MIVDLANSGSLPVLEKMLQFAGARQKVLAHNIANMETPDFQPMDLSTRDFQHALAAAAEDRRQCGGGQRGELNIADTDEVHVAANGALEVTPQTPSGNILYHDRNNRDLERMMQDLAENALTYRATADFIRREHELLRSAIAQRP